MSSHNFEIIAAVGYSVVSDNVKRSNGGANAWEFLGDWARKRLTGPAWRP